MDQQGNSTYNFAAYGRWVIVVICVVFLVFSLISIGYVNRRRNRNGLTTIPFTNFYPFSTPPVYTPRPNPAPNVTTTTSYTPNMPTMPHVYQPPRMPPDSAFPSPPLDDVPPPAYPEAMASVPRPKYDNAAL
ncbi:plasma membrane adaptor for ubiquitin ligase Rcr1 [Schizosaccharomyces osmophilus]|uniref:Plasma membrane adaptor for ubiquitin ligase Rcr1 n=1 Tax=Schizosaccharomyces osmophilus TaxID=2545709 RepID=A0AAE9W877_9SCHI|nr:plasma membrane adaptor for ubiquitin ligase Rcr1 [Schizosaccharomyces osmophilus]WBW71617.1 plasma membrane adaptor for ubiquitin ligase Rcr1 [Schizosaccharomyces osmophilus]